MAARRGRPPATRGVYAIDEPTLLLPSPVALDTSFIVAALIPSQRLHAVCAAFSDRIIENGVSVVTSELLAIELAEAASSIALRERWGREWRRHRTDGRARRRASRLLSTTLELFSAFRSSVSEVSVGVSPVVDDAVTLMSDFGLASYDAVHAATAIAAGAEALVTLDTGFALLPSSLLSIYSDRSRVASCRRKRPS